MIFWDHLYKYKRFLQHELTGFTNNCVELGKRDDFLGSQRIILWKELISQAELNEPEHMDSWKECQQNKAEELLTGVGQRGESV